MSGRSYLSIGDVLTLLRQEFEDITISKIRFLESQGLVNPERTPSGYRKFYEHDVERLRWVLRQQREHFLPLKVIKDRLDDGSADVEAGEGAVSAPMAATKGTGRRPRADSDVHTDSAHAGEPVLVGPRMRAEGEPSASSVGAHPAGEGAALPGIGGGVGSGPEGADGPPTVTRAPARPGATPSRREPARTPLLELVNEGTSGGSRATAPDPSNGTADRAGVAPAASAPAASATAASATAASGHEASGPSSSGSEPVSAPPVVSVPPTGDVADGAPRQPKASTPAPAPSPAPAAASSVSSAEASGVSLSADELAAAAGIDLTVVGELQEYGLLVPSVLGGVEYFDEEALAVATAAAGFTRFGIEPRHLRIYRNAAEREAGFVEQVVLPLVRQRNPEARARAHETADELARLGQQLRASLLRSALTDLLNG